MTDRLQEMRATNERQAAFYDTPVETRAGDSLATRGWFALHDRIGQAWRAAGIKEDLFRLHREWAGDPAGRRVLELGVYYGSTMTRWLAERAGTFIAVDLSTAAVEHVRRKLGHLPNVRVLAGDFLAPDFPERDLDLVYAAAVLHHFRHFDGMLDVLTDRLAAGGRVITHDPLNTALSSRAVRGIYRRWQADTEWEWPFTRDTLRAIERRFRIVEVRGVFGTAKWALPLAVLFPQPGARALRWLYDRDMRTATRVDRALWRCMQVTMLLEKR